MQSLNTKRLGFFAATAIGLSSCNVQPTNVAGVYVGDYSRIENGKTLSYRVTTTIGDLSKKSQAKSLVISLTDMETHSSLGTFEFDKKKSTYTVKSSLLAGATEVSVSGDGPCFNAAPVQVGQAPMTTFCIGDNTLSLFSTDPAGDRVLIYMNKGTANGQPLPTPANDGKYGLNDLFHSVLTTSYDTRIATEKLYQAQETEKVARAALFPSVTAAGIVSLIAYPLGALNDLGQLVPFVFPTTWFAYDSAKYTYNSQVMSYKTLVANQMNLVEDLYHETLRDTLLMTKLEELETSLEARTQAVALRVEVGYQGSSDLTAMNDLVTKNKTSISTLQAGLTTELASLSAGIGLSPRNGITALTPPVAIDFTKLQPLDSETLMAEAKSGSLDIRETMYLESAAQENTKSQEWSVINPSGWVSLDESIPHKILVSKGNLAEVQLQQTQTEESVEQQVIAMTALYNEFLAQNLNVISQIADHQKNLDTVTQQYQSGTASIDQYTAAIEDVVQLQCDQIQDISAFAEAQGKLNRLLWTGGYTQALGMTIPNKFL